MSRLDQEQLEALQRQTPATDITLPVRWGDLDALGHVNNIRFIQYLEEARCVWLSQTEGAWGDRNTGPVVVNLDCNFRQTIQWPATARIRLYLEPASGRSVTLRYLITDADNPATLYADASTVLVWIDTEANRSIDPPAAVLEAGAGR